MARLIDRFAGFVIFVTWLAFFAMPFAGLQGTRDGIFLPSPEWNAQVPWALVQGMLVGLLALVGALIITALCIAAISRGQALQTPTTMRVLKIAFFTLLLVLPFWGWGFERSVLRAMAHENAPSLAPVTIEAVVNSYYITPGGRRRDVPRLNLRVPPYGRLQIQHHPTFRSGFEPQKGMTLLLAGERTWVGAYYDTVQWPENWLAEP